MDVWRFEPCCTSERSGDRPATIGTGPHPAGRPSPARICCHGRRRAREPQDAVGAGIDLPAGRGMMPQSANGSRRPANAYGAGPSTSPV